MYVYNASANSSQLRRAGLDSQRNDKDKSASNTTANQPFSAQKVDSSTSADVSDSLKALGDKASGEWNAAGGFINDKFIDINDIADIASEATDKHAAELFTKVDTNNPTFTANQAGFDISSSQGPENSAYIDLGNGAEVFVITTSTGKQIAYRVENGELGDRIPDNGTVELGNGIYINKSESPAGASEINFQQGPSSVLNLRPSTITLNSDNSMLTIKNRQGSNVLDFFRKSEVNSFDIQSGEQIVTDGVADLDKMSPTQQFDYYADTPEGKRILGVEGSVNRRDVEFYNTPAEQRLFVARVQYSRGEGGPEVFNEFTPRRANLSGDELAQYDAAVQDMMNEIREQGTYTKDKAGLDTPLDESMLYMLASAAVEAYGSKPEHLEAVQADIDHWKISVDNEDGFGIVTDSGTTMSGAWYRYEHGEATVQFNLDTLIWDYANPNDQFEIVTHELAHSLDNVNNLESPSDGYFVDGIPPGLSDADAQMFIDERERLFGDAYPGKDVDSSVNQDHNTVVDNNGFANYTFHNRKEFFAKITETFLSSDEGAEIVMKASPKLYNMLREYYGREDLPEAVIPPGVDFPPIDLPPIDLPPIDLPPIGPFPPTPWSPKPGAPS